MNQCNYSYKEYCRLMEKAVHRLEGRYGTTEFGAIIGKINNPINPSRYHTGFFLISLIKLSLMDCEINDEVSDLITRADKLCNCRLQATQHSGS